MAVNGFRGKSVAVLARTLADHRQQTANAVLACDLALKRQAKELGGEIAKAHERASLAVERERALRAVVYGFLEAPWWERALWVVGRVPRALRQAVGGQR